MPASTPAFGIPKVALVMAKLIVDGEDRGSRFFVVPICTEREMHRGVSSTRLPTRSGTGPLDFSITSFNHVHLPPTALVASDIFDLSIPAQPLESWWNELWRIQLGTIAVPAPWISAIKAVAFIGGRYSTHRSVIGKGIKPVPIISFRTQQWPVLNAIAVGMVMSNWYPLAVKFAMEGTSDHRVRHAMAVIAKATVCRHFQRVVSEVAERCGAQGTFEHNYMARIEVCHLSHQNGIHCLFLLQQNDGKGVIIAEGDILTVCIRLFSEMLLGRYTVPLPDPRTSLLAKHASSIIHENAELLRSITDHRSDTFNSLILPQSQLAIEAVGHAMAYSAAVDANLPQPIIDLYECSVLRQDPAWYSEHGVSRMDQRIREDAAVSSALPHLSYYLDNLGIENYVSAPIVSDAAWKDYLSGLPVYTGNAISEPDQLQAML